MSEPVLPMTVVLQQINMGVQELKADVRTVRDSLSTKADSADVRELQRMVTELQRVNAADEAAANALHSVSTSRRAIWLAISLPCISTLISVLYQVFATK